MARSSTNNVVSDMTITNRLGLHARAAALLRETAQKFRSEIKIIKNHMEVNAKSLLGLLALGAAKGTTIKVMASGSDAHEAIEAIKALIENKFNEKE